jgi:DNA-binding transcriptional ArsR family regulator
MSNTTTPSVSRIAAAIGEPARARMLHCLMDGHTRASTELAIVAEVSPSTASVHLNRLKADTACVWCIASNRATAYRDDSDRLDHL